MSKLAIYLRDHHAASVGAAALARRVAASNRGTRHGEALAALAGEVEEDHQTLERIMQRLGVRPDRVKVVLARGAEKLGRLKLNGQLVGYSPLSRLEELEILALGLEGKLAMWQALERSANHRIAEAELQALIDRARLQLRSLERQRLDAADEALAATGT